jgi:DNA-binding NtrC family response regulator
MTGLAFDRNNRSVLIVDDEPGMRTALQANFLRHGWNVKTANGVREAASAVGRTEFDLVVSDIRMRDGDGFEVMNLVRKDSPLTAVILLTAFGNVPDAVKSMRSGAFDYLTKPVSFDQLQAAATRIMQRIGEIPTPIERTRRAIRFESGSPPGAGSPMVGRSPLLLQALHRARAAASTDADVLIEAESGTGKELMARFIHETSDRSEGPFVAVNCAAIPEHLIESELFGHAQCVYPDESTPKIGKFELANGGTLLLDEIGEMPLNLQPKLLRVLQEREFERLGEMKTVRVNIRVIATANVSLSSMVEQGSFRSDLYYRLNVIPLSIPALRERSEDIPTLAHYFAEKLAAETDTAAPVLDRSFLDQLHTHSWPGNIRELANFMRRVVTLHQGAPIDAECFRKEFQPVGRPLASLHTNPVAGIRISDLERLHLENTLALAHGNRTHAAEMLGISLRTVRNKIKEYGLPPRSYA